MILHTVNASPARGGLDICLRYVDEDDALVLLEDGVYAATAGAWRHRLDTLIDGGTPVYAIKADVDARGLTDRLIQGVQVVDYRGFVNLCANYKSVKSWF